MTIDWKAVAQYFTVVLIVFNFIQFVILENLSTLDLALSGVNGLKLKIMGLVTAGCDMHWTLVTLILLRDVWFLDTVQ